MLGCEANLGGRVRGVFDIKEERFNRYRGCKGFEVVRG